MDLATLNAGLQAASSIAGLFGGGGMSDRKAAALQYEYAQRIAQNQIQWRVADAKAAGIHPLYALGANVSVPTPSVVGSREPSMGERLSSMGQDISRAVNAYKSTEERAAGKLATQLALEKAGLENDLLRSQIARENSAQLPPGLNGVNSIPTKLNNPDPSGQTGKEAGVTNDWTYTRTASGGLAPVASADVKERIEDAFIPEISHAWRNNITPNLPWNWRDHPTKPPKSMLPARAHDWFWSMSDQSWKPVYNKYK